MLLLNENLTSFVLKLKISQIPFNSINNNNNNKKENNLILRNI